MHMCPAALSVPNAVKAQVASRTWAYHQQQDTSMRPGEPNGDGQQRPFAQKDSMKCQIDHTVQNHCSAPRDDGVRPMVMRARTTSSRLVAHIDEKFRLTILQDAAIRRTARRRA